MNVHPENNNIIDCSGMRFAEFGFIEPVVLRNSSMNTEGYVG